MKLLPIAQKVDDQPVTGIMKTSSHLDYDLFPRRSSILVRRSKSVNGTIETTTLNKDHESRSNPTSPKRVHFADSNGRSLVEVKQFISNDIADVLNQGQVRPRSVSCPLPMIANLPFDGYYGKLLLPCFSLKPCFQLPDLRELDGRVKRNNVCLENITTDARVLTVSCRVKNIAFDKIVSVRFTFDKWDSFTETHGHHIHHSVDGETDKFEVKIHVPKRVKQVEFAVKYQTADMEFWDNNDCKNYIVENST